MLLKKIIFTFFILLFSNFLLADEKITLGLNIYNSKGECSMCHTLIAAKSSGQIGPNLDLLKPQLSQIISAVNDGIGVMPAFQGALSSDEIEAVAYFVFESTNQ